MRRQRIEGVGRRIINDDVQAAIEAAGKAYKVRYGLPATHVALPKDVDPSILKLWNLNLAHHSGPGVVILGRPARRTSNDRGTERSNGISSEE